MPPWLQITGRSNIIVNLDAPICPICCALEMASRQLARNQTSWKLRCIPDISSAEENIPKYFDIYINPYWCQKVIVHATFQSIFKLILQYFSKKYYFGSRFLLETGLYWTRTVMRCWDKDKAYWRSLFEIPNTYLTKRSATLSDDS